MYIKLLESLIQTYTYMETDVKYLICKIVFVRISSDEKRNCALNLIHHDFETKMRIHRFSSSDSMMVYMHN